MGQLRSNTTGRGWMPSVAAMVDTVVPHKSTNVDNFGRGQSCQTRRVWGVRSMAEAEAGKWSGFEFLGLTTEE